MKDICEKATLALKKVVETMKQFYNKFKRISINYKAKDLI